MKISREELTIGLLTEAATLSEMHNDELVIQYGSCPNMNKELIVQLSDLGMAHTYVARVKGVMVAYIMYFVSPDILYKNVTIAGQEAFFVHPEHRGMTGIKLLRFSEIDLAEYGVEFVVQQTMKSKDVSKLYERLGYKESSTKYLKKL